MRKTLYLSNVLKNFDHALFLREDDPLLPAVLDVYEKQGIKDGVPNNVMKALPDLICSTRTGLPTGRQRKPLPLRA